MKHKSATVWTAGICVVYRGHIWKVSINYFSEQHVFHFLKQKILHDVSKKFSSPPPNTKSVIEQNRFTPQSCFKYSCRLTRRWRPCCLLPLSWKAFPARAGSEKEAAEYWATLSLLWEDNLPVLLLPLVFNYQLVGLWQYGSSRDLLEQLSCSDTSLSHLIYENLQCCRATVSHKLEKSKVKCYISSLPLLITSSSTLNTCETEPWTVCKHFDNLEHKHLKNWTAS